MSYYYGPSLVKDGLISYLDAANPKSYASGSTTWNDLSGNNNSASLINGPAFSNSNKGTITFDGTNDYATLPLNFFNFATGNPFSVSIWFKTTSSLGSILGNANNSDPGAASGYVAAIYVRNDGKLQTSCFWGGLGTNSVESPIVVNDGNFHNITVTFSGSLHLSYLDGVLYSAYKKTQTSYASNYYYHLGRVKLDFWPAGQGNGYFQGNINNFMFYNRALSGDEILQNINAVKGRYNVVPKKAIFPNGVVLNVDASNPSSYVSGSSIWYDLSGYANSGSLINGPTFDSGSASGSIVFDGVDDYIKFAGTGSLSCITAFSVESWIYPTKNTGTQNVVSKSNNGSGIRNYIYPRTENGWSTSVFYLFFYDDSYTTLTANWPSLNAWHHSVAVYDGTKMYIYINGVLANSKNQTGYLGSINNESYLTIGSQEGFGPEYFGGKVGAVKIYNYGLSASEVSQSYNATKGRYNL